MLFANPNALQSVLNSNQKLLMSRGFTSPEEINDGGHPGPFARVLHNQITFVRTKLVPLGHLRGGRFAINILLHPTPHRLPADLQDALRWLLVVHPGVSSALGVVLRPHFILLRATELLRISALLQNGHFTPGWPTGLPAMSSILDHLYWTALLVCALSLLR